MQHSVCVTLDDCLVFWPYFNYKQPLQNMYKSIHITYNNKFKKNSILYSMERKSESSILYVFWNSKRTMLLN